MEEAQVVGLLVRRCVGGDAAAWEEIVQRYHRRIYNVCYRFAGDAENAQDLTQEVLLVLHEKYPTVDRVEELLPLSLEIARFKIVGARRKIVRICSGA